MIKLIPRVILIAIMFGIFFLTKTPVEEQERWNNLNKLDTGDLIDYPVISIQNYSGYALPEDGIDEQLLNDWNLLINGNSDEENDDAMTAEEFAEYMAYDLSINGTTIKALTQEAKDLNPDVVGWIYIPDTKINYPILYRKGESNFYLNYNSRAKRSSAGSIFLDDTSNGKFSDLSVIHGHSMKDKTMFGTILDYKNQQWAEEHNMIYIFDGTYVKQYEIFACFVLNADNEDLVVGFNSTTARDLYYSRVMQRSLWKDKELHNANDTIALSTCSYEASNFRCLVYASCILKNGN